MKPKFQSANFSKTALTLTLFPGEREQQSLPSNFESHLFRRPADDNSPSPAGRGPG
jgi:hypothetical protein